LALTYAVAVNGMVLTPFLVAAVMRRFGLNEGAATGAVGVEIIGLAVSCAIFPRWISRAAGQVRRIKRAESTGCTRAA